MNKETKLAFVALTVIAVGLAHAAIGYSLGKRLALSEGSINTRDH